MPYTLRNQPVAAKRIWIAAFNSSYEKNKNDDKARKAAWAAVKVNYHKVKGKWKKKN